MRFCGRMRLIMLWIYNRTILAGLHRDTPRTQHTEADCQGEGGERQDLSGANSFISTMRTDVGALEVVVSCDVRQCTRRL